MPVDGTLSLAEKWAYTGHIMWAYTGHIKWAYTGHIKWAHVKCRTMSQNYLKMLKMKERQS